MKGFWLRGNTFGVIRFAYFTLSPQRRKNGAKRDAPNHIFSSKTEPWVHQGRLGVIFWLIFEASKNRWFFYVGLGRRKIDKNLSLEQPGVARPTSTHGFGGSRVPGRRQIIKEIDDKNHEVRGRTRRLAVGRSLRLAAKRNFWVSSAARKIFKVFKQRTSSDCWCNKF